jgi:malonyl-CoA/methylmalonyl-CoA synthetase
VLFPPLLDPARTEAVVAAGRTLTHRELRDAARAVAVRVEGLGRVAVLAEPCVETAIAVVGGIVGGAAVVPVNPAIGERELAHVVSDSAPGAVLTWPGQRLPPALARLPAIAVGAADAGPLPRHADPEAAALVLYTSGTTGPPKGAVLPQRAIASNLDALARAWAWTRDDVLVHGLPVFHAHGLVLGTLGPIRLGGRVVHVGRFDPHALAEAVAAGGTMVFGVPTMYARLAAAAEADRDVGDALSRARLLVSGSAALPAREHARMERATGQRIVERYGLTETLMNCAVRADGDRRPGYVGPPLDGVELRLVDDAGSPLAVRDDSTIGEVHVRGPNLFTGYLNRPEATAAALDGDWFRTGDLATIAPDGYVRIVGRRATDLIKTGGYKIGAGEVESALLEHPDVAEVAVTGEPDDDLGERVVAWVVPASGRTPDPRALEDHVARLLAPHKRPRVVRFVASLPRNELGKVQKTRLREGGLVPGA